MIVVLGMSKQEDFHRPEKSLEITREIDNEARTSKEAKMKIKFNRNQKRITLWDIQLSSLIYYLSILILYCIILYYIILNIILYYIILYYIILYYILSKLSEILSTRELRYLSEIIMRNCFRDHKMRVTVFVTSKLL